MRRRLTGTRATAISASGSALVALGSPRDVEDRCTGVILVIEAASPDLVFVIRKVAGVVTTTGGPACHAAILAREFGVACVVGVADALDLIRTGDPLTIDGRQGEVHVHGR